MSFSPASSGSPTPTAPNPTKRYLLALDTSSSRPGAALADVDTGVVVADAALEEGRRGAEALPVCVRDVLASAAAGPESLAALAVVRGPGSFTGIRVGLSMARGLALVDDLPTVGVDSLEVLVHSAGDVDRRLCAVLAAAQDKVYAAGYVCDDSGVQCTRPPAALSLAELDPMIADWGGRVVLCAERPTLDLLRAAQAAKLPDRLFAVPDSRARSVAELGLARLDSAAPAAAILPLYVAEVAARPNTHRVAASSGRRD